MGKTVEISEVTGKAKRVREDNGRIAAKKQATMTSEQWQEFQTEKFASKWSKPEYMAEKRAVQHVRDGGEGAYRDKTYEIVTRWRAETNISYRPHAKKPGSKSHIRYEKYAKAKTVGEALKLGSYPMDWCFDYEHGFIKVAGPVQDEPMDPSKLRGNQQLTDVDKVIMHWFKRELAKRYNLDLKDLFLDKNSGETVIMRAHRLVANRKSEEFLKAAAKQNRAISDEEVTTAMFTWAFAKNPNRVNVLPDGQDWVWSDTMGLLRDRTGDIHITKPTTRYPAFVKLITQWLFDRIPPEVDTFKFTSLNLNCNYAAKRHRDGNNFGPSFIKAFGSFTGGELNVFPEDDRESIRQLEKLPLKDRETVDLRTNMAMWNGNSAHEVQDFVGNRYSVVYFAAGCHAKASDEDKAKLRELGFPYPATDEDPEALLDAPVGYGKGAVPKHSTKLRVWNAAAMAKRSKRRGWAVATPTKGVKREQLKKRKGGA